MGTKKTQHLDGLAVLREVLEKSQPRPDVKADTAEKIQYAVKFADQMAARIADALASRLRGITATTKKTAKSIRGNKQLDINFSTPEQGLALGISLKSVHLRDYSRKKDEVKRYTHNKKRNEEELRIEASGYHKRQPFAVMIGVLFLPFESCDDAKKDNLSSFGSWVRHLRPYTGRRAPDEEADRFEKLYIALYEPDGTEWRFFDIESDPPRKGRPSADGALVGKDGRARRSLAYTEFIDEVYHTYLRRNDAEFRWADGEEEPITIEEEDSDETEEEDA